MSNSDSSPLDPAQSRSGVIAQSGPAPVQVRCWSSHCVRVGDVLSGSGPHGVGSVSGSSGLGQVGSRSVRLRLAASDSGSGPVWLGSSVSGSCPASVKVPRVVLPLHPSRKRPVRLRPSGARLRSRIVSMGLQGSRSVQLGFITSTRVRLV